MTASSKSGFLPVTLVTLAVLTSLHLDLKGVTAQKKIEYSSTVRFEKVTAAPAEAAKCRKFFMVMGKRMTKVYNGCVAEVKEKYPQPNDFSDHFQCIVKCSMQKVDILDSNYNLSNATFTNFITKHIPEEYHALILRLSGDCIEKYTSIIKGNEDPYCKTHGDFVKCLQTMVDEVC